MFAIPATTAAQRGIAAMAIAVRALLAGPANGTVAAILNAGLATIRIAANGRNGLNVPALVLGKDTPKFGMPTPCGFIDPGFEGKRCASA